MAEQGEQRVVVVEFVENGRVAIVRMQHADNRVNPKFIKDFNSALDEVERCNSCAHIHCAFLCIILLLQRANRSGHGHNWSRKILL